MVIWIDHILLAVIAVIIPGVSLYKYRQLLNSLSQGETINRVSIYSSTIISQWVMLAVAGILWYLLDREWSLLGLHLEFSSYTWLASLLTVITVIALVVQLVQVRKFSTEQLHDFQQKLGVEWMILPQTPQDLRWFNLVSCTAGIVEEILWRGLLIWYLNQFFPFWIAATGSILLFTLAHSYQGLANIPKIAAVATLLTLVYWLTGAIWLAIILHIVFDLLQGRFAFQLTTRFKELVPNNSGG